MDCQLMKAIHKLQQNEFHAQKKSILIVASFLLHCNLSAEQSAVTSRGSLRALCSPKQYLFSRASPQLKQVQEQLPATDSENQTELPAPRPGMSPKPRGGEPGEHHTPPGVTPVPCCCCRSHQIHLYTSKQTSTFTVSPKTGTCPSCLEPAVHGQAPRTGGKDKGRAPLEMNR